MTLPDNLQVRYRHYRDTTDNIIQPKGGGTAAFLCKDGETVAVGAAICSKRDNFVKRIGREIALGRALKEYGRRER